MGDPGGHGQAAAEAAAQAARQHAYAPYSNYAVGCAIVANGVMYTGANIENASYGLTICAERVALAHAVMAGVRTLDLVVVTSASQPPAPPCGMCRQSLIEFCADPAKLRIVLLNDRGQRQETSLAALLPMAFTRSQLDGDSSASR